MKLNDIRDVAVIGSGVIGYSWALSFAMNGHKVHVYDVKDDALKLAKSRIHDSLENLASNKVLNPNKIEKIESRISYTKSIENAVKNTKFIIESGTEKYEVKWSIVNDVEKYASEDAIIASSTSGLLITEIAKNAKHPERFIGAHPYNPPHLIPLVEITKGEKTTEENVKLAYDLYKSIKMQIKASFFHKSKIKVMIIIKLLVN